VRRLPPDRLEEGPGGQLEHLSKCGHHFRIDAVSRIRMLFDGGDYEVFDAALHSTDPLGFVDSKPYVKRLEAARLETGLRDALVAARGKLGGRQVEICSMEVRFIGGSMGRWWAKRSRAPSNAPSRPARRWSSFPLRRRAHAGRRRQPDANVQDLLRADAARPGPRTLYQCAHRPHHRRRHASFAMLGDLNIAEPGALIGFAGPRVIEQTIRQKLPEGFQRSEFLVKHGMLDAVVPRLELKAYIARAFDFFCQQ